LTYHIEKKKLFNKNDYKFLPNTLKGSYDRGIYEVKERVRNEMEVEFITLGDASERLNVPSPTLRNWTDQLEEFNVHFVKRNNRNERIYYDTDLEIFAYVRDLKQEYGRRTTMKDISNMLKDEERFTLRSQEDAPTPVTEPSNKTADLINAEDIQRLMENQRVRALIGYMIGETTKQIRGEILEEIQNEWDKDREVLKEALKEDVKREIAVGQEQMLQELHTLKEEQRKREEEGTQKIVSELNTFREEQKQRDEEERKKQEEEKERIARRDSELMKSLKEVTDKQKESEEPKGFFAKLFGNK
jgi:MerR HTH family regulatory protein